MLKVNEVFYSLQGEGSRTGHPTVFVRLSGCNLKCSFCDTKHEFHDRVMVKEVVAEVMKYKCDWVCITGGEPTLQEDTVKLVQQLSDNLKFIQLETNGTNFVPSIFDEAFVTVSPKKRVHPEALINADEIKIVVTEETSWKSAIFKKIPTDVNKPLLYLQPESNKGKLVDKCVQMIKEKPQWALSLQMQKIVGIR